MDLSLLISFRKVSACPTIGSTSSNTWKNHGSFQTQSAVIRSLGHLPIGLAASWNQLNHLESIHQAERVGLGKFTKLKE